MNSGLDDLVIVIEWLASTKTPTGNVAEAMERLRQRTKDRIPVDVMLHNPETTDERNS